MPATARTPATPAIQQYKQQQSQACYQADQNQGKRFVCCTKDSTKGTVPNSPAAPGHPQVRPRGTRTGPPACRGLWLLPRSELMPLCPPRACTAPRTAVQKKYKKQYNKVQKREGTLLVQDTGRRVMRSVRAPGLR